MKYTSSNVKYLDLVNMNTADDLYHQQSAYATLKQNTIASDRIQILEKMASGQFGTVYKGWSIFTLSEIENHGLRTPIESFFLFCFYKILNFLAWADILD